MVRHYRSLALTIRRFGAAQRAIRKRRPCMLATRESAYVDAPVMSAIRTANLSEAQRWR
jgi:hypothetical protein